MEREVMDAQRRRRKGALDNRLTAVSEDAEDVDNGDVTSNPIHNMQMHPTSSTTTSTCVNNSTRNAHVNVGMTSNSAATEASHAQEVSTVGQTGGTDDSEEEINAMKSLVMKGKRYFGIAGEMAKEKVGGMTKEGLAAARSTGRGVLKGVLEMEKQIELATFGAYFKTTSTAFVTFRTRSARSVCYQSTLSHDEMRISPAPGMYMFVCMSVGV